VESLTFLTEDGVLLEGELRLPDGGARATAVICHAHPRFGGSKDHPVLWALRNELAGMRNVATLGFNFRGIMGSAGSYGGGRDEMRDLRGAIDRVRVAVPGAPTIACGWSFGASVALREALLDDRVAGLVLIGLPLAPNDLSLQSLPDPSELASFPRPALLVAGGSDAYCPTVDLRKYAAGFPDGRVAILDGADHFLGRREREAAGIVGNFVDSLLS
jgi:alpha/beta superfamily hydrolase